MSENSAECDDAGPAVSERGSELQDAVAVLEFFARSAGALLITRNATKGRVAPTRSPEHVLCGRASIPL
ncbi:Hypothetical protein AMF_1053 [Anaplasma marginale str. Florida]|uniref:Uncharacterized protein n=1 Tax=Anaplasma marginale (strain Florida) TaxID=320483 RepID=B9KGX5_ANAMF|nr:Hypothetical protein AMF_1053 [Anaplasma marginale str. Florida]